MIEHSRTVHVAGQIRSQVNFDLAYVDSQFPLSSSPNRQRESRINLG